MKFIRDYNKFKASRINERLESGQFLVYHRTRLKFETFIVDEASAHLNWYDSFAKKNIPFAIDKDSEKYKSLYDANYKLLVDMNPNFKLDYSDKYFPQGRPIIKPGDKIVTSDPRIMSQGFRPGAGDWYGVGVYTCYEFEDQIRDFDGDGKVDMAMYGPNIVEFRVQNNKKFLILDMNPQNNQAKKVWGEKHTLIDQLKKIMGGKFLNFYNRNKEIIDSYNEILVKTKVTTASGSIEELKKDKQDRWLTAPIALRLAEMPEFISLVDGISFTGGNDGKVLVIYDANLTKPTRYTEDDGKTWHPMEKMDYQYEKVKVGNNEILQCKIIDTDKELNQINLDRPGSSKWISSLDVPTLLKDKEKSIKVFSEMTLNKSEFKDSLSKLVKELLKSPKQVLDNVITRACQLPTDISQLPEGKAGNYYSSLLYFIGELGKKSNYQGDLISKKTSEIFEICNKYSDKLNFPLDLVFELSESVSVDNYKELFTRLVNKSKTLTSGELRDRDGYEKLLNKIKSISESENYPNWFKDLLMSKIDSDAENNFEQIDMNNPNISLMNGVSGARFSHLFGFQIKMNNYKNVDKFCEVLKAHVVNDSSLRLGKYKLSPFYEARKSFALLNVSYFSYPSSWGGQENWLVPKLVKISDKLDEKSIEILVDFCITFFTVANPEDYRTPTLKFEGDGSAQKVLAEFLKGTIVYDKIIEKITKLRKEDKFTLFGVEDNELKTYYTQFFNSIDRYIDLDKYDDLLPDLNYDSIADKIFQAMYGPGTETEDIMTQFEKIRNKRDLEKVITSFGERKGMIGGKHDLNWWIKDELKRKDLEKLNNMLKEKGIDYQF